MSVETLETSNGQDNTAAVSQQETGSTLITSEANPNPVEGEGQQGAEGEGNSTAPEGSEGDKKPEGEKPDGAPEQYEDFTAAEGVELDAELTEEFKTLAKDLNLPQDKAQQVVDLGNKLALKLAERQQALVVEARTSWANEAKADQEFGGEKLAENLSVAKKAMDAFGTPELKALLNESGLGNHPEVIRVFYRAGKAISEDRVLTGGGGNTKSDKTRGFYPNSNMN